MLNLALHCTLPPFCSSLRQRCFIYKIKNVVFLAVTADRRTEQPPARGRSLHTSVHEVFLIITESQVQTGSFLGQE